MLLTRKNPPGARCHRSRPVAGRPQPRARRRAAPSRRWTGAPSCAAPASASAPASRPRKLTLVRKAQAADAPRPAGDAGKIEVKRTVCAHCSVGCAIDAVVENGVWVRQEPVFDSPINLGAHCAKGAALREHGHGEYRLQVPDEAGRRQVPAHQLGPGARRDQRQDARAAQGRAAPTRSSSSARPSTTTSRRTCCASGSASGAATTATTRRASATRPRSPASPTPGATAR